MLTNSNHNNGLRVRLLELGQIQWTTSAQNAENLKEELLENYGHAGKKFVEHLLEYSDEEIIEQFKRSKEIVKSKIQFTDSFTDRIADKIATVYMTAEIAREALALNIDSEKILDMLIEADAKQVEDRNIGMKAYEYLKQQITTNINKFIYKNSLSSYDANGRGYSEKELPHGEILGRLEMSGNKITEALITKEQLKKILADGGFTDIDVLLNQWRNKGLIDADEGKFTRKRALHEKGVSIRVVVIKMNTSMEDDEPQNNEDEVGKSKKVVRKKKSSLQALVEDNE